MKRIAIRLAAVHAGLLSLLGCAATAGVGNTGYEVDGPRVAAVERAARSNGVDLIWIHQPVKKTAVAGG